MYSSSWEYSKTRSKYHFDNNKKDKTNEWFWVLGKFKNTWAQDLVAIKEASRPMTWENRKFTMGRNGPVSPMIDAEEYDVIQGGGNPKMTLVDVFDDIGCYPNLQKIVNFFGLEQSNSRIHVQRTGNVFNRHIDKLDDLYPGVAYDQIIRFAVMLEDWKPGQFYQYGNLMYENWSAGEVHYFDWINVPHATANASNYPRYTLQVTGIRTDKTNKIIQSKNFNFS
jgi:hypothetical protein